MPKQHLEHIVSKWLTDNKYWYLKLQVIPLAHKTMPADFIVLTNNGKYLIECKEVKCDEKGFGRFDLSRLSQLNDLLYFNNMYKDTEAYVFILFWNNRLDKSILKIFRPDDIKLKMDIGLKSIASNEFLNNNIIINKSIDFDLF